MEIFKESMPLISNKLANYQLPGCSKKEHIKNEGLTRDVIENNGDKNWHPVMLMKNKLVTTLTP